MDIFNHTLIFSFSPSQFIGIITLKIQESTIAVLVAISAQA